MAGTGGRIYANIALTVCMVFVLNGCVFSETITEIIYEQNDEYEVDYSAQKIYINSPTAQIVSDQIPSLTPIDEGTRERLEGYPQFDGDLSDADVRESHEGLQEDEAEVEADRSGSNWDPGSGDQHDDSVEDIPEMTQGNTPSGSVSTKNDFAVPSVSRINPSTTGTTGDAGSTSEADAAGKGSGSKAGGTTGKTNGGGGADDGSGNAGNDGDNPDAPGSLGRNPGASFGDVGSLDNLPDGVHSVAAVGNAAIVAAALGGVDGDPNLVAADADVLGSSAVSVLANRGIGSAEVCWSGTGAQGGADLARLIELNVDAVLVTEGESPITAEQADALMANGTNIVYVPAMSDHEKTVACVQRIGSLLGKGGDSSAAAKADEYRVFTNDLINQASSYPQALCSLYIDRWITGVSYSNPDNPEVSVSQVAFAPVGGASYPLSQYMATAGVQNSAAAGLHYKYISGDDASAIVWPLVGNTNDSDWIGITGVNAGIVAGGNDYDFSLTRCKFSDNNSDYVDLGMPGFPKVIVKDSAISTALATSRDTAGLYSSDFLPEKTDIRGTYGILVNPCGIFSSWVAGSMESPLEMAWITQEFHGTVDAASKVSEFYSSFYGYTLSDELSSILNGAYAE